MKPVCVLAFAEPPAHWGFKRSRAGTSWFIRLDPQRIPRCLTALKSLGIEAKALWPADERGKNPLPSPGAVVVPRHHNRPRGKAARAAHAEQAQRQHNEKLLARARRLTAQLDATEFHIAAKRQRTKLDAARLKAELAKQAQQARDREQVHHAQAMAELLRHCQGSA